MMEIGKRCAAYVKEPISSLDHGDFLYIEAVSLRAVDEERPQGQDSS
jgi:hypothetical protein